MSAANTATTPSSERRRKPGVFAGGGSGDSAPPDRENGDGATHKTKLPGTFLSVFTRANLTCL